MIEQLNTKNQKSNELLSTMTSHPEMPHTVDYVSQKQQLYVLEKGIKELNRKIQINTGIAKKYQKFMRQQQEQGYGQGQETTT